MDALSFAYQQVWDAFQESGSTEDGRHDTGRWSAAGGVYAACIIRIPVDALQPRLSSLRETLSGVRGVRQHPDHFLHIMLQELGFVVESPRFPDELTEARLEEFAQAAAGTISTTPRFTIRLGGANSFQDAVFLDVGSGRPLLGLHERLFDLAAIPSAPEYPYLPHCTVAHYDGTTPHYDAMSLVGPWRNVVFGEFAVTEAEIVTFDTRQTYPELATYAVIPFTH